MIDINTIRAEITAKNYPDYATAFAAMSAETNTTPKTEANITEGMILSGLGMTAGSALIAALEANLPAPVIRVLQSKGINVADPEAITQLGNLLSAGVISQTSHDWLVAQGQNVEPKWPGLKEGHVQNAFEYNNGGLV